MQFRSVHADPETEMAAVALVRMLRDRQFARYQTWLETSQNFPREWRDAAGSSESIIYLTPTELDELSEEVLALVLPRFRERLTDPARRRRTRCRWRSSCCPTRSACPRPVTSRPMTRPAMIRPAANRLNQ